MPPALLIALIVVPAAIVVLAICLMLWSERTSPRTAVVAAISGVVLIAWMLFTCIAARHGSYLPPAPPNLPAIGIQLVAALAGLVLAIVLSPSLRSLLTNQKYLIRLNVWRLVGAVFVALMLTGEMPALWALPAGLGDVLIGATAFWVARHLDEPGGRRRAMIFNWLGMLDLFVAVGLGNATSPGPLHLFDTTPTAEMITHFPLALVPGFLVPLAFMVHVVSQWQLAGRPWLKLTSPVATAQSA
jgi:hypothetical protein